MRHFLLLGFLFLYFGTLAETTAPPRVEKEMKRLRQKESYYWSQGDWEKHLFTCYEFLINYGEYLSDKDKATWNIKLAEALTNNGSYLLSVDYLNQALKYPMSDKLKAYAHGQLAGAFIKLGDYEEAVNEFMIADKYLALGDQKIQNTNSLGYTYFLAKNYQVARKTYNRALEMFSQGGEDSIQYRIIQSNLASLDMVEGNHASGLKRLHWLEAHLGEKHTWFSVEVCSKLLKYYLGVGDCAESKRILALLAPYFSSEEVSEDYRNYVGFQLQFTSLCQQGVGSDVYFEEYERVNQALLSQRHRRLLAIEELQRNELKKRLKLLSANLKLKKESEGRYRNMVILSVVLLVVLLATAIVWFRSARIKQRRKEDYLSLREKLVNETEKSHQLKAAMEEKELENKKLELMQILHSANDSATLFEELRERLKVMASKEGDIHSDVTQLLHFLTAHSNLKTVNETIEKNIALIGGDFKERFFNRFPGLTQSEEQLVLLIRIGLSTKEMSLMRNVEPSSIRIFKHRLKTKLELDREQDLTDFIQNF